MSRRADIILALKALAAAALPAATMRGFDGDTSRPRDIGPGGTVIGHPGTPGDPEIDLSPLTYNYDHELMLEFAPPPGTPDAAAALDRMMGAFGAAVQANRTLGGLVHYLDVAAPEEDDAAPLGGATVRWAMVRVIASYSTTDPLN